MLLELEAQDAERRAALRDEEGNALTLSGLKETYTRGQPPGFSVLEDSLRRTLDRVQTLTGRNKCSYRMSWIIWRLRWTSLWKRDAVPTTATAAAGGCTGRLLLDRRA